MKEYAKEIRLGNLIKRRKEKVTLQILCKKTWGDTGNVLNETCRFSDKMVTFTFELY